MLVEDDREHLVFRMTRLGKRVSARDARARARSIMLVLLSMTRPTVTGTSPALKNAMSCALVVFEHRECALRQIGHRIASPVEDVDMQHDELCACFEDLWSSC